MEPLERLVQLFKKFPGIGQRQARRFAYFILRQNEQYVEDLVASMRAQRSNMRRCVESFQYFYDLTPARSSPLSSATPAAAAPS